MKPIGQWPWPFKLRPTPIRYRRYSPRESILLAVLAIMLLTGAIGYPYYNQPRLTIDTPAPQTFHAPADARIEDRFATATDRKAARTSALNVWTINQAATAKIKADLTDLLQQAQALRNVAGPLPFMSGQTLSLNGQQTLRRMDRQQLDTLLTAAKAGSSSLDIPPVITADPALQSVWLELQAMAMQPGLAQRLERANAQYQFAQRSVADRWATLDVKPILDIPDPEWPSVQTKIKVVLQRMLSQGIAPGVSPEVTQSGVAAQVADWSLRQRLVALECLPAVLQTNLIIDPVETFRRQELAAQQIQPSMVSIRQGEVIVWQNQRINSATFALMDHFGLSQRQANIGGLLKTGLGAVIAVALFCWIKQHCYGRWTHQRWTYRDDGLVLLLALSVPITMSLTEVTYTPLPMVGLLIGSFYGSFLGLIVVVLLSLLVPLGLPVDELTFGVIGLGSLVGSAMAGYARSREELARVSLILGLVQAVIYAIALGATMTVSPFEIIEVALRQGLIGIGWCIVALGLSPYLEKLFDLVTPIRLAELANPNRPMLQQLAERAPGTFQHTLFVTTLAEAGARAMDCNVELVRTGTLYHDIGKLHAPDFFIENQFGGPNKHADINNPWQSAEIIRKHVSEGLVMARKIGLPTAVQAFIPEHQGNMLIAFFYHQACQQAQQDASHPVAVLEADFRYAGPTPQSRETGIVMLADSCEAALRAMKHSDPALALRTIKQIFKARWEDQQLIDARLSRDDLEVLAQVFVSVWQQVNHERIPYPQPMAIPLRKPYGSKT